MKTTARIVRNIEALLAQAKMSEAQLARKAKIPPSSLNRLMVSQTDAVVASAHYSPTADVLERLAKALGVTVAALLSDTAAPPAPEGRGPNPFQISREVGRLVEDFMLSSPADRARILGLASECAAAP